MKKSFIVLIAICAAVMLLFGPSVATTHAEWQWKVGTLSIPASDLRPVDPGINYSNKGVYVSIIGDASGEFVAPICLPNFSFIYNVYLEAHDPSEQIDPYGGVVSAYVEEYQYTTVNEIVKLSTTRAAGPGNIRIGQAINYRQIFNDDYSYGLRVYIDNGLDGAWGVYQRFYKFVITYCYPIYP